MPKWSSLVKNSDLLDIRTKIRPYIEAIKNKMAAKQLFYKVRQLDIRPYFCLDIEEIRL
jgi:hypothetical protein